MAENQLSDKNSSFEVDHPELVNSYDKQHEKVKNEAESKLPPIDSTAELGFIEKTNIQEYNDIDHVQALITYSEKMNLGTVEFSNFNCITDKKITGHYSNVKIAKTAIASSLPERSDHPDIAKQIAARNALAILKNPNGNDMPVTQDIKVVAERLEEVLHKNKVGLFCDNVGDIYKVIYKEKLPENWLDCLNTLTTDIMIEHFPDQGISILYCASFTDEQKYKEVMNTSIMETYKHLPQMKLYTSYTDQQKNEEVMNTSILETYENLPLMKFIDKKERRIKVVHIDNDLKLWILFIQDSINSDYDTLFKRMNMPNESDNYHTMYSIELFDIYAVKKEDKWYRFQPIKIQDDINNRVIGILIDLGVEWFVSKSDVKYLNQKFLNVPSQAIKCSLTSLAFAHYFQEAKDLFYKLLLNKEFVVLPDNIENDPPLVTLYRDSFNLNTIIVKTIKEETNFKKIDEKSKNYNLCYIDEKGYLYIHPPNDTLINLESIFNSISATRSMEELYSKRIISSHKIYLVKYRELGMWCRAKIDNYIFAYQKINVYFIDYGNYGIIDQDKFIDLESIDPLLAAIGPQALKVAFYLFPPEKLTINLSKPLFEMVADQFLDINVKSTNSDGTQVVELFDAEHETGNRVSFNTLLYLSV